MEERGGHQISHFSLFKRPHTLVYSVLYPDMEDRIETMGVWKRNSPQIVTELEQDVAVGRTVAHPTSPGRKSLLA